MLEVVRQCFVGWVQLWENLPNVENARHENTFFAPRAEPQVSEIRKNIRDSEARRREVSKSLSLGTW